MTKRTPSEMAWIVVRRVFLGIFLLAALAIAFPFLVLLYVQFAIHRVINPKAESLFYKITCRFPILGDLFTFIGNYPEMEDIYRCLPPMKGRVLHVACGTGFGARVMKSPDNVLVNLDINRTHLEYAKRIGRIDDYVCGSAYELPFPDNSFDYAILPIALHHFQDCDGLMRECGRVLRPKGVFIVFDPVSIGKRDMRPWNSFHDGAIWRYDRESIVDRLRSSAQKCGMRIRSTGSYRAKTPECYNVIYNQILMIVQIEK